MPNLEKGETMRMLFLVAASIGLIDPTNAPPLTPQQMAAVDATTDCLQMRAKMYDDEAIDAHELAKLILPMCMKEIATENAAMTADEDTLTKQRYMAQARGNELHEALLAVLFERSQWRQLRR
jgi:hypothetical protein